MSQRKSFCDRHGLTRQWEIEEKVRAQRTNNAKAKRARKAVARKLSEDDFEPLPSPGQQHTWHTQTGYVGGHE